MVNYQKTEQSWNSEPVKHSYLKYEKPPEQKGHEAWLQKVTNPHTNKSTYKDILSDFRSACRMEKK
jgi:hypothetical protein